MNNCIFCKRVFSEPLAFGPDKNPPFKEEIDLGLMYPSSFVPKDFNYEEVGRYETKLISCSNCGFVQMSEWPLQDDMYKTYFYRSGLNSSMVEALGDVIAGVYKRYPAITNGFRASVLDIAANDCTLLGMYPKHWFRVGVDPAANLVDYSKDKCDLFINDYFGSHLHFAKKFDIITCIAMFYDLIDTDPFMYGVKHNLAEDGIFVVQMTDLASMIKVNAFDNICHEHCGYWTLDNFINLMFLWDMDVFDVEYNSVNGSSIRMYCCHYGRRKPNLSVEQALKNERQIVYPGALNELDNRVVDIGNRLMEFIRQEKAKGKKFCGLGASTKGNTLLQTFGFSHHHIDCIGEVNEDKVGSWTIGSHIPIVKECNMFETKPDYVLILPHHFKNGIVEKNKKFLENGGKFLVALPEPTLIDIDGESKI